MFGGFPFIEINQKAIQKAHKGMKSCVTPLNIRKMQIKTISSYHFTPITMTINKKIENNKCWQECEKMRTLVHCWWEIKWYKHCGMVQLFFKKVINIYLSSPISTMDMFTDFREKGRSGRRGLRGGREERGRDRETPTTCLLYVPWPGFEPQPCMCPDRGTRLTTFWFMGQWSNQLIHTGQGSFDFVHVITKFVIIHITLHFYWSALLWNSNTHNT